MHNQVICSTRTHVLNAVTYPTVIYLTNMATVCPLYTVRRATRSDVPTVKTMTDGERWEMDLNFLYCVFDLDSRAWFVAEIDTGEIVGEFESPR